VEGFSLKEYTVQTRAAWDRVVSESKNGNFLHLRDYMDYHADSFEERSVLVMKQGKPVAVFPCNRLGEEAISHGGLTYGGLIYGQSLHAAEVLHIFSLLKEHYRAQGIQRILYKAIPHIFHSYPAEEDLYALFRNGAHLYRRDISSAIPLASRMKLSDSRKCTIRKAVKHGVEIAEGDFMPAYHKLLSGVVAKFGAEPVHTLEELELLKSRFPGKIRLFGAFVEGTLLAGTIIYDFGRTVHTQYLASSDEGRKIGALDHVLSHLIENVFNDRAYFSFGISTEQAGKYLNEGLIFQKEGFGGRGVVHDSYELEL
jgi:hypothetical protein